MKQIYTYHCSNKECNNTQEAFISMEDRNNGPQCDVCGADTYKIISPGIRSNVNGVSKGNYNSGDYS